MNVSHPSNMAKLEVVVYDPENPSTILSPAGYECTEIPGMVQPRKMGLKSCSQYLGTPKDLYVFRILTVALDEDGYVIESRLDTYGGKI